ncbi:hypothetical protein BDZ94DRAFT_1326168 [Collybia nuda]|uniref:F-box domain-containing protein n=1 Tax=Collybia nuda TaxID=64659 RepID=A0A9P6C9Q8_9AGAR|nr:hypothetical protein BDZ94DRAFT_1326168 [Collybia nuda]
MVISTYAIEDGASLSNDRLSDQEFYATLELLSVANTRLESLIREVGNNPSLALELLEQHKTISKKIEHYHIALAPHKMLPPELLSHIFVLCSDDLTATGLRLPLHHHKTKAPWSISYVCSRWRQIALANPHLWNTISVQYTLARDPIGIHNTVADILMLPRCGEHGVSLTFGGNVTPTIQLAAAQNDLISKYAHRIRHLKISSNTSSIAPYLKSSPLQFTLLNSLKIETHHLPYESNNTLADKPITLFEHAHSLRKLEVSALDRSYFVSPKQFLIPWSHLTDLALHDVLVSPKMTLSMLQECVALVNCTLTLDDPFSAFSANSADYSAYDIPIVLPNLHSLTLYIELWPLAAQIYNSILTPSLRILSLTPQSPQDMYRSEDPFRDALISLLRRSKCSLDQFMCRYRHIPNLHQLLDEMPCLRALELPFSTLRTSMLVAMCQDRLLPNLEFLECEIGSAQLFLDFLESRRPKSSYEAGKSSHYNVWGYDIPDQVFATQRITELWEQFSNPRRSAVLEFRTRGQTDIYWRYTIIGSHKL